MTFSAYLTFDGNCREAMNFYKDCLGGELALQTVEGSPVESQVPAEMKQAILHSALTKGTIVLMGSDMRREQLVDGNTVTLSLQCDTEEELDTTFAKFSAGGKITDPLADQFWGAKFGTLVDKFGKHWMFNFDKTKKQ